MRRPMYAALGALLFTGTVSVTPAAIPLETYLKLTDVAFLAPSPDGAHIAYTSQQSGTWQVWVMNFDGSGERQITHGKDAMDSAQWVPGDGHTILTSSSVGGSGVDQFYYVRDDRPGLVPLFPKESSVTHGNAVFSPDGSMLAFASNLRKASVNDVYVLNRKNARVRRVYTTSGTAYPTAWSPDGTKLIVRLVDTPYNDNLYVVDVKTGASRLVTPHQGDANFDSSQFTHDMRGILCVSDFHNEFHAIQRIDIVARTIRPVLDLGHDIDQVLLSPDGKTIAYIVNREGYGDVVVTDAATGRITGEPIMPPYISESLTFARSGRVLLYNASGPTFPKVMWAYDLQSRKTTRLITPDFHGLPPGAMVEPELVHVKSFDGRMIPAFYYRPQHVSGKLTVLLDMHGGPEEQDRVWDYPFAQYLVSRGYGLLDPNVRGSTGYGRTFLHLADGRKREDAVKDVEAMRQWLVRTGGANPSSIFIDGASYGGYLVLASLYHYPHAYAGGMDVYGVTDWVDFLEKTAPDRRANREGVYGSLQYDRAFLASISPINHVSQIESPVLISAGRNDTIVPVAQDERMAAALKRDGVPVELHIFPDEGHGFAHVADLTALYTWEAAFMSRYAAK